MDEDIADQLSQALEVPNREQLLAGLAMATHEATFAALEDPPGAQYVWVELLAAAISDTSQPTVIEALRILNNAIEAELGRASGWVAP